MCRELLGKVPSLRDRKNAPRPEGLRLRTICVPVGDDIAGATRAFCGSEFSGLQTRGLFTSFGMTFASDMACMTVLLHYQVSDRRIRWWKYSFQLSGSAAMERVCLAEARSPALYFFATYKRAISATDTEFGSRPVRIISSPAATAPSRATAR